MSRGRLCVVAHLLRAQQADGDRRNDGLRDADVPVRHPRQPNLLGMKKGPMKAIKTATKIFIIVAVSFAFTALLFGGIRI